MIFQIYKALESFHQLLWKKLTWDAISWIHFHWRWILIHQYVFCFIIILCILLFLNSLVLYPACSLFGLKIMSLNFFLFVFVTWKLWLHFDFRAMKFKVYPPPFQRYLRLLFWFVYYIWVAFIADLKLVWPFGPSYLPRTHLYHGEGWWRCAEFGWSPKYNPLNTFIPPTVSGLRQQLPFRVPSGLPPNAITEAIVIEVRWLFLLSLLASHQNVRRLFTPSIATLCSGRTR